jgi:hypothetical protein
VSAHDDDIVLDPIEPPFAEAARRYSELGWALIRAEGKKPKGLGWEKTQPKEPGAAAGEWSVWGDRFNMGIVLGPSNVVAVDVDIDEDPEGALLEFLEADELPPTPIWRTGRGRLVALFRDPGGLPKMVHEHDRGQIELRAGAHQCIAPPSVHPDTGLSYHWLPGHGCSVPLLALPDSVVKHFESVNGQPGPAQAVGDVIPVGQIDTTLASLAGSMARRGMSEAAITAALVVELERCEKGHTHTEKDCLRIARSVLRTKAKNEVRPDRDAVGTHPASPPSVAGVGGGASPRPDCSRDAVGDALPSGTDGPEFLEIEFTDVAAFAAEPEEGADAVVGDGEDTLIAENDDVMMYGDGGAGKTTLANDLAVHLAAGDDWLDITVPKAVRVGLIENEGPRPLFRRKLRRKLEGWTGSPLEGRLKVMNAPWGKVSLDDARVREALATAIGRDKLDVIVIGPVTRSGMNEAGTLQHVRDFLKLFAEVRALVGRRVTFILIHHENRAGAPSGAWEGAVSTLFHVQAQGHGRTRLHFQKARWGDKYHLQTLNLGWAEGQSFVVLEEDERDDNTVADEILAYVREHGGTGWNDVDKGVAGKGDRLRKLRGQLLDGGRLVNRGPEGRGRPMELWCADDPALPPDQTTIDEDSTA